MPGRTRVPLSLALVLALGAPLLADTIYKKDGRTVEGTIAQENADNVVIETKFGPVTVPRAEILRIEKGLTPADDFKQRWEAVDRKDVLALLDLADFCSENNLTSERKKVYTAIIAVDPDNEIARTGLGYVLEEGEWLSKAEIAKRERDRKAEERKAKKEASSKKADAKGSKSQDDVLAGIGDVSADIAPFLAKMGENTETDKKTETELFDFFGQRFTVATSEHFSLRAQMPMDDTKKHLAIAERIFVTCNKLFGLPADNRMWPGQYMWFHVKQKGTFIDLVDWLDKYVVEIDPEQKKRDKDAGGLMKQAEAAIVSAKLEQGVPLEHAIVNESAHVWMVFYTRGQANEWLREGFGAYMTVADYGINQLWHTTTTKYAGRTEIADKDSDAHLKLVCLDICDGVTEKPYPYTELWRKKLNDLDYADLAKSYSLVDFLITEHLETFKKFLQTLATQPDEEIALKTAFGWTAEDLDRHWKEYVLANYDRSPAGK
jgi:hypothetical protein